jgi:adenine-specific DNA-methyltransferase
MPTLNWIGKEAVVEHHRRVPTRLLECDQELSVGNPEAENLLVEGDNLEALKALLPRYRGQVKCIYIDPPYNTGNESWIYNDNVNDPRIRKWLGEVVGREAEDLCRHDKWLCMMYPRLALLREFLREDGVIFVSIDDNEISNLLATLDAVFSINHRVAIFTWIRKKKGSNLSKEFRKITEYVVAYKNTQDKVELYGVPAYSEKDVPLLNRANPISKLKFGAGNIHVGSGVNDGKISARAFGDGELVVNLLSDIEIADKVITTPFEISGRFRWSQETVDDELQNGSKFIASKTFRINVQRWNQSDKYKALSSLLSPEDGIGTNEDATDELRQLFPEREKIIFDFAKPSSLVEALVRAACKSNDTALILDSFGGSGTTGHGVLKANLTDNGQRRFLLVEIDSDIAKNVTRERLRRVINNTGSRENGGGRNCAKFQTWFSLLSFRPHAA